MKDSKEYDGISMWQIKESIGETPQECAANILVYNGKAFRIILNCRKCGLYTKQKFISQSLSLFFIPLICIAKVMLRFRTNKP